MSDNGGIRRWVLPACAVVAIVIGCWLPQVLVFVIGLLLLGLVVARLASSRTSQVLTVIGVLVVGLVLPWAAGRWITNRDVTWRGSDLHGDKTWVVGDRVYLNAREGLQVTDAESGRVVWSIDDAASTVAADGSVIAGARSLYSSDGEQLWDQDSLPAPARLAQAVVARSGDVTVLAGGKEITRVTTSDLTLTGVRDDGTIAWTQEVREARIPSLFDDDDAIEGDLPAAFAVRQADAEGDSSRLLIIDPKTGDVQFETEAAPMDLYATAVPVGEAIIAVTTTGDHCQIDRYDSGELTWSQPLHDIWFKACGTSRSPALSEDVLLVDFNQSIVAVSVADGTHRRLNSDEVSSRNPQLAGRTVVRSSSGAVRGTDALTGERLWSRDLPWDDHTVYVDGLVVLKLPTHLPNPLVRPGMHINESDFVFDDFSRRITVLDPSTGEELASVVDRLGSAADTTVSSGSESVVVGHRHYGPTYRISAGG